jgi:tryptophan synthase alpha chain
VGGAILADLSLEEIAPWAKVADEKDVATVLLVAPSTPIERVGMICERSRGFIYAVARMGVTGEQGTLAHSAGEVSARIKSVTDTPVLIGVGVSTPEQAKEASAVADGVVVGSALVRRLLEGGGPNSAGEFVATLRHALDEG